MAEQQRYRVIKRLAAGGMAEVFVAESAGIEGFKKQVAIKRVLPALSRREQFIAMFLDEARLSAHLSHCNVVSVFDIGVGDGTYFIVMEYVDGSDLKNVLECQNQIGESMPLEAAVFIATKMCQGLAYAHELTTADGKPLRIVHRDITPANVLMTKYGEVKIVDFGLARASSQLAASEAGMIKGKYGYLAPETVMELPVDHRVDIFSVGIILWEMLAGQRLFLGRTELETVRLVHAAAVPSLAAYNPTVPRELEWILARALARDPSARYQSAGHFGRDLTSFLYRYGRPVSEYEVADLVRNTLGLQSQAGADDGLQKISQYLDMMLFEFKSLTSDSEGAPLSVVQPESVDWRTRVDEQPLGGLADALEGPEPEIMDLDPDPPEEQQQQQQPPASPAAGVAGWFRGLIR